MKRLSLVLKLIAFPLGIVASFVALLIYHAADVAKLAINVQVRRDESEVVRQKFSKKF